MHCEDANLFLLNSNGFDYIDIDPFGTPNPFLDSAIKRISRQGILAITATDTAALCGTYPDACQRKYWATPNRTEIMHEIGLRILIRKCQLIGAQFDKALIPIFSYSIEHYMRIFFLCEKGKKKVDETLAKHGNFNNSGPMWLGSLWEEKIIEKMILNYKKIYENNNSTISSKEIENLLNKIKQESKINAIGFYHLPSVAKRNSLGVLPKQNAIIESIIKKGYVGSPTHFKENSIRTNISEKELSKIIKEI